MTSKTCNTCKSNKPLDLFYVSKSGKDGHTAACRSCIIERSRNTALKNHDKYKEYLKEYGKKWRVDNKEKMNLLCKKHYSKNKQYYFSKTAKRKLKIKERVPQWGIEFTDFAFEEAFDLCKIKQKLFGVEYNVDHIVPLNGENVSGLHVWNNFAVITATENREKGNTHVW
jgi:hypothetical protein